MTQLSISTSDLEAIFKVANWSDQISRLGKFIRKKLPQVQLIGQIEAEEGFDTYLKLKESLRRIVSTSNKNGYPIFNSAQYSEDDQAVLALYAVWTSIYSDRLGNDASVDSYWKVFYDGFHHVTPTGQTSLKVGTAVKNLLDAYEQLISFPNIADETSWVHVSPIFLHGLPAHHVQRFIKECVLTDSFQKHSTEGQRQQWAAMIRSTNLPKSTLLRFFEMGGDAALTLTRSFIELRDCWNERGEVPHNLGLPKYMQRAFENTIQGNESLRIRRIKRMGSTRPPLLKMNLERYLQPFLEIPVRLAKTRPYKAHICTDSGDVQIIELRTFLDEDVRKSRMATPEEYEALLVAPAQQYGLKFSGENEETFIKPATIDHLIFDAESGKLIDVSQDIRWPETLLVVYRTHLQLDTNGTHHEKGQMTGTWSQWLYTLVYQPTQITLSGVNTYTYHTKKTRTRLKLFLYSEKPTPYWVHVSNGFPIYSDLQKLRLKFEGISTQLATLALYKKGVSYPIERKAHKNNEALKFEALESLQPGIYTLRLEQGLDNVSHTFVYIPGAEFKRSPINCQFHLAHKIEFYLPDIEIDIHQKNIQKMDGWYHCERPHKPAISFEMFPNTEHATFVYLMMQDIRWRRYGHAHVPRLDEMRTTPEVLPLHHLEELHDTRLRVEVETPLMAQNRGKKAHIEIRRPNGDTLITGKEAVRYHNYAFWDFDMLSFAQEAKVLSEELDSQIVLNLGGEIYPLVNIELKLQLQNLRVTKQELHNNQQVYELTWEPQKTDPALELIQFYIGNLEYIDNFHIVDAVASQPGYLSFDLSLPHKPETWGVYPVKVDPDNPFANEDVFISEKSQYRFEHHPLQKEASIQSCKADQLVSKRDSALWHENFLIDLENVDPDHLHEYEIIAHPVQSEAQSQNACLKPFIQSTYQFDLEALETPGFWTVELWRTPKSAEPYQLDSIELTRISKDIEFGPLQLNIYGSEHEFSWDKPTPRIAGELYFVYQSEASQKVYYQQVEPRGNHIQLDVQYPENSTEWVGYIALEKPISLKGKLVFEPPEHPIYWKRPDEVKPIAPLKASTTQSIENLLTRLEERVTPRWEAQAGCNWSTFLETYHRKPAQLVSLLGAYAFKAVSPMSKGKFWKVTQFRFGGQNRKSEFEVISDLEDLTLDFELLSELSSKEHFLFYTLSNHPNGVAAIDLKLKNAQETRKPSAYRMALDGQYLSLKSLSAPCVGQEKGNNEYTLEVTADMPLNLWDRPFEWEPHCLDTLSKSDARNIIVPDLGKLKRMYQHWPQAFEDRISAYKGYLIKLWLNNRFSWSTPTPYQMLLACTGTLAIISRLAADVEHSEHFEAFENGQDDLYKLLDQFKQEFMELVSPQNQEALSNMLIKDALLAELIERWYLNKFIVTTEFYTFDNPESTMRKK